MSDPAPISRQPGARAAARRGGHARHARGLTALTAVTALTASRPELRFAVLAPDVDLLINGVATLVAGAAAWLSWLRHRHMADRVALYQAAAFVLFTVTALPIRWPAWASVTTWLACPRGAAAGATVRVYIHARVVGPRRGTISLSPDAYNAPFLGEVG